MGEGRRLIYTTGAGSSEMLDACRPVSDPARGMTPLCAIASMVAQAAAKHSSVTVSVGQIRCLV
jgi:hypothetical protein